MIEPQYPLEDQNWQKKTLVTGVLVGALTGLIGAVILIQSANRTRRAPQLSAGDGVKVGLGVLGILRMISDM